MNVAKARTPCLPHPALKYGNTLTGLKSRWAPLPSSAGLAPAFFSSFFQVRSTTANPRLAKKIFQSLHTGSATTGLRVHCIALDWA
jgi:hypothetical protein